MNTFKKNKLNILLMLFSGFLNAQPGYYGAFEFKIFNDKKLVDLSDSSWKIMTNKNSDDYPTKSYKYPDYYLINVTGGSGKDYFFVDIIFKKDTMRIYPPSIDYRTVTLDSIAFKKGVFKIPTHIYDLQDMIKYTGYNYIPTINGDWNLFSVNNQIYKCYIEKVEDLDKISSPINKDIGSTLTWHSSTQFYFKKNFIIKNNDDWEHKYYIFELKNISDTTFWGGEINQFEILSLYSKKNYLYALIKKNYEDFNKDTYGVYKLHFVDQETISEQLSTFLKNEQIKEDYQSAMKLQGYSGALREKIIIEYSKIAK